MLVGIDAVNVMAAYQPVVQACLHNTLIFRVITVLAIIGLFVGLAAICVANPIKVLRSVSCVPAQIANYLHSIYHHIIIIN